MVKVIPKRAEFARRMEVGTQWALDHNLDIMADPQSPERIDHAWARISGGTESHLHAGRKSVVSDMWKAGP